MTLIRYTFNDRFGRLQYINQSLEFFHGGGTPKEQIIEHLLSNKFGSVTQCVNRIKCAWF